MRFWPTFAALAVCLVCVGACQAPPPTTPSTPAATGPTSTAPKSFANGLDTCSKQNKGCTNYCLMNPDRTDCSSECASRMNYCMATGTYLWLTQPNVTGLTRE